MRRFEPVPRKPRVEEAHGVAARLRETHAFPVDAQDFQVSKLVSLNGVLTQRIENAAGATIAGLELEASVKLADSLRVDLNEGSDFAALKQKEPMLRDAIIRASYRTPFGKKDDVQEIDEARLKAAVKQAAIQVLGAKATGAVTITSQKPRRYLKAAAKTAAAH